jgi:hypothetical protein
VRYRVEAVSSESVRMVIESVSHSNEPPSLATFSPDLNATTVGAATFSPFFARLRFPLNVGDQWIARHTSSNKARTINHEVRAVASAWDSLALPKSPLQCIRVEVTDTFVAPPQGLTIVGRESNCYSPLAKYIVKAERVESDVSGKIYNHSMWELTDFEVK